MMAKSRLSMLRHFNCVSRGGSQIPPCISNSTLMDPSIADNLHRTQPQHEVTNAIPWRWSCSLTKSNAPIYLSGLDPLPTQDQSASRLCLFLTLMNGLLCDASTALVRQNEWNLIWIRQLRLNKCKHRLRAGRWSIGNGADMLMWRMTVAELDKTNFVWLVASLAFIRLTNGGLDLASVLIVFGCFLWNRLHAFLLVEAEPRVWKTS